jgi:hypothetical protein
MDKKELAPGIVVYSLPDITFLLSEIEDAVSNNILKWEDSITINQTTGERMINKYFRNCTTMEFPYNINTSLSTKEEIVIADMSQKITNIITAAENDYIREYTPTGTTHQDYQILKYPEGGHQSFHIDDWPSTTRRVSVLIYLNEDYEGGELEFPRFNVKHKPKENEMIIFPSAYIYSHLVNKIESGTRYCIVSWLS